MASRSNTSVFTIVFTSILGVVALVFFITTVVFWSNYNRAVESQQAATNDVNRILEGASEEDRAFARQIGSSGGELSRAVGAYRELAAFSAGNPNRDPSEVRERLGATLSDAAREALDRGNWDNATGDRAELAEELRELAEAPPETMPSLNQAVETLVLALEQTISARAELEESMETTLLNAREAIARVEEARNEFQSFESQQRGRVDDYARSVEQYSDDIESAKSEFQSETTRIRRDAEALADEKDQRIASLEDEVQQLREIIRRLDRDREILTPANEAALIDGELIGVNLAANEVYLSLGRGDKLPIGITFTVYDAAASVLPNASGEFPPGKATIEVTRVDGETSTARILESSRGNRIVAGDKIVNAIYDPDKTYEFVVFGNFDANNDFVATPAETNAIRALIRNWGGTIVDDLSGQTDFLVLGERPILPPQPGLDAPAPVIQAYAAARSRQQRYDRLFEGAQSASIPVLNQNRLETLTGLEARR